MSDPWGALGRGLITGGQGIAGGITGRADALRRALELQQELALKRRQLDLQEKQAADEAARWAAPTPEQQIPARNIMLPGAIEERVTRAQSPSDMPAGLASMISGPEEQIAERQQVQLPGRLQEIEPPRTIPATQGGISWQAANEQIQTAQAQRGIAGAEEARRAEAARFDTAVVDGVNGIFTHKLTPDGKVVPATYQEMREWAGGVKEADADIERSLIALKNADPKMSETLYTDAKNHLLNGKPLMTIAWNIVGQMKNPIAALGDPLVRRQIAQLVGAHYGQEQGGDAAIVAKDVEDYLVRVFANLSEEDKAKTAGWLAGWSENFFKDYGAAFTEHPLMTGAATGLTGIAVNPGAVIGGLGGLLPFLLATLPALAAPAGAYGLYKAIQGGGAQDFTTRAWEAIKQFFPDLWYVLSGQGTPSSAQPPPAPPAPGPGPTVPRIPPVGLPGRLNLKAGAPVSPYAQ